MREIKFRVWNGKEWLKDEDGSAKYVIDREGNVFFMRAGDFEDVVLPVEAEISLYTGLKDKNGKEIYEGDIVKILRKTILRYYGEIIGVIKYDKSSLDYKIYNCIVITPKGEREKWSFTYYFNISDEIEVIGNIYENPELLEEVNDETT